MYADDTIVMADSKEGLQRAINRMYYFCEKWKLRVNNAKTKVTIFSNRKPIVSKYTFICGENELEIVHNFKYLGIVFNFNGSFKLGIEQLKSQASRAMFSLLNKCRTFDLPIDITLELFDCLVVTQMLYACEVWGENKGVEILEKLHLKFLKYVLKVKQNTCNNMVYGELGRFPLNVAIKKRIIGYWGSLLLGKQSKLSKIMYDCLLCLYVSGVYSSPWICNIKSILDSCGIHAIWINQQFPSLQWLRCTVERKLKDLFISHWRQEMANMSSCDLYMLFKEEFKLEKYLICTHGKVRQAICNSRTQNTRIPKVTGRYRRLDRNLRICNLCSENKVGDEFHVLFECRHADIIRYRADILPTSYTSRPSMYKVILLLQSDKTKVITKLGAYLKNVLLLFR